MGLSVKESETGRLLLKDRDIEIAKKMFLAKKDIKEILEFTELTEEEFQKEVVDKFKEDIKIINEDSEVAIGLSVKDSETGKLIAKDIYIEMAKKMFIANKDIKEILELTELTEEEFQKKVVDKFQKEKN